MISASTAAACSRGQVVARRERVDGAGEDVVGHQGCEEVLRAARLPDVGQHRLGVELDALGGQLAVADGHHDAAAAGGDLEAVGELSSSTTSE